MCAQKNMTFAAMALLAALSPVLTAAQEVEEILINDLPAIQPAATGLKLWNPRRQLQPQPVLIDDRQDWNRAVRSNLPKFQPAVLKAQRGERRDPGSERREPEVHLLPPAERPFEVVLHQSRVVKADRPIVEFVVANPDTADVKQLRPDELVLIGRGPGVTTLTLWLEDAEQPRQFTVMCQPSEPRREREQRPEPAREHIEHLERQLREAHEALQHTSARLHELQVRMQRQAEERERSQDRERMERERIEHERMEREREMDRRPEPPRHPETPRRRTDD